MSSQFYTLKVQAISNPIPEATSISFAIPPHLQEAFSYYPGQHLIIKFIVNGKEARRSYSLNSSPFSNEMLQITVKRVKGGLVSNYVGDKLKVGDELAVMVPQGRFYANVQADEYKTYFLFAAGSGITPIISILKSVLLAAPYSMVNLFYGNANQNTIIFEEQLAALQKKYPERLQIVHTLSSPKVWSVWKQWEGKKGRIDTEAVTWFINNYPPIAQSTEYYICGPGAMNIGVRNALIDLGVPKNLVHIEQFGGTVATLNTEIKAVDNAALKVTLNGTKYNLTVPKGKTILQVLKEAKINPPYSCESGVCATCIAKVNSGKAEMKACMALEDDEIKKGMILTCQAIPVTKSVAITFS